MNKKENLLLSADGDIFLYKVDKEILENFDELLKKFYSWKKTNIYDETLFVKFLKNRLGKNSIECIKTVGIYEDTMKYTKEHKIEDEYKDTFWYNF